MKWQTLLKEKEPQKADNYVVYLRRSIKQSTGENANVKQQTQIDKISIRQQEEACRWTADNRGL